MVRDEAWLLLPRRLFVNVFKSNAATPVVVLPWKCCRRLARVLGASLGSLRIHSVPVASASRHGSSQA